MLPRAVFAFALVLGITRAPVYAAELRPLSTDRPDTTESPYTVDAGHFQAELSFVEYVRDRADGVTSESTSVLPLNLKVGLRDNVDLQFLVNPYISNSGPEEGDGIGDLGLRLKVNLWGNDEGTTAFAIMPFMTFPTGADDVSSGHAEGGFIFPLAIEISDRCGASLMAEVDFVRDTEDSDYEMDFVHTATIGFDVTDALGVFTEYEGSESSDSAVRYRAASNTGVTYALSELMQLDAGIGVGLNDAADDFRVFSGFSVKY